MLPNIEDSTCLFRFFMVFRRLSPKVNVIITQNNKEFSSTIWKTAEFYNIWLRKPYLVYSTTKILAQDGENTSVV